MVDNSNNFNNIDVTVKNEADDHLHRLPCIRFVKSAEKPETPEKTLFLHLKPPDVENEVFLENEAVVPVLMEPAEEDVKLLDLLTEFNLQSTFVALTSCGFTYDRLQYITKDDLDVVFPEKKYTALKAELREKIFLWKRIMYPDPATSTGYGDSRVCSCNQKQQFLSRSATKLSEKPSSSASEIREGLVSEILKLSYDGQGLIKLYTQKQKFEKEHRKKLMSCIVEYYYNASKNTYAVPSRRELAKIAEQIQEIFPNESSEIYYVSRKDGQKSGMLFNKFNNLNKKRKTSSCNPNPKIKKLYQSTNVTPATLEMLSKRNKMQRMENYEKESMELWMSTFSFRTNEIQTDKGLDYILEEWPFFKQSGGEEFIDYDFTMLYPDKKYFLINKWTSLKYKLYECYKVNIKTKQYKDLFEKLADTTLDKNSKDCIFIMLLNAALTPTSRFVTKRDGKFVRSIKDAIIVYIKTSKDLEKGKQLRDSLEKNNTIQPCIIVIGPDITSLKEFYVNFGQIFLKCSSFISAFDICFKVFQVFRLEYPKQSSLVWLFIQKYIFIISTIYDRESASLCAFIENLTK